VVMVKINKSWWLRHWKLKKKNYYVGD
jgi:hypothetical protein